MPSQNVELDVSMNTALQFVQGDHSSFNEKFPDISLTFCSTPTYAALTSNPKPCFHHLHQLCSHYCYNYLQKNLDSIFKKTRTQKPNMEH